MREKNQIVPIQKFLQKLVRVKFQKFNLKYLRKYIKIYFDIFKKGMMMKILISGGAGYIGSHTLRQFLKTDHEFVF